MHQWWRTSSKTSPAVKEWGTCHSSHGLAYLCFRWCLRTFKAGSVSKGRSQEHACHKLEKNVIWLCDHHVTLHTGQGRKAVTRINSMPNIGSSSQQRQSHSTELQRPVLSHYLGTSPVPLEVGSMVEVVSSTGITVYGVIRWMGVLPGKTEKWAGIELVRY